MQKEHEDARTELKKLEDEATVVMDEYKEQEKVCSHKSKKIIL